MDDKKTNIRICGSFGKYKLDKNTNTDTIELFNADKKMLSEIQEHASQLGKTQYIVVQVIPEQRFW